MAHRLLLSVAMITDKLKRFITAELLQSDVKLDEDTLLLQSGTLTSLQTIGLVEFIQNEFGVEIEPEEISEREFKSLRTIGALVTRKLQVARGTVA